MEEYTVPAASRENRSFSFGKDMTFSLRLNDL